MKWEIVCKNYEGLTKKGVNEVSATLYDYIDYVIPVLEEPSGKRNVIEIKKGSGAQQGYSIEVQKDRVTIEGNDDAGVLYGCMDFCQRYVGDILCTRRNIWKKDYFKTPFEDELPVWQVTEAPSVKTRAIWSWGHVIYDYKGFFDNMARLRLNEAVPINAKDIVDYAHALGIKVVWGFAWGWDTACKNAAKNYDRSKLPAVRESVIETYESQYKDTGADGIYFQSFTELKDDSVGDMRIADAVVELVNDISGELLKRYPDLHVQFGLHATSVKDHLDVISKVDPRVYIVWEDCGAFPFEYYPENTDGFEDMLEFTKKTATLRENEKYGAVLKGTLKLDWGAFKHFEGSYVMGQMSREFIRKKSDEKARLWKLVEAAWLTNAHYLQKTAKLIADSNGNAIVQALVEDAVLEDRIMLPVAIYARLLWNPDTDADTVIREVAKYPCVSM